MTSIAVLANGDGGSAPINASQRAIEQAQRLTGAPLPPDHPSG